MKKKLHDLEKYKFILIITWVLKHRFVHLTERGLCQRGLSPPSNLMNFAKWNSKFKNLFSKKIRNNLLPQCHSPICSSKWRPWFLFPKCLHESPFKCIIYLVTNSSGFKICHDLLSKHMLLPFLSLFSCENNSWMGRIFWILHIFKQNRQNRCVKNWSFLVAGLWPVFASIFFLLHEDILEIRKIDILTNYTNKKIYIFVV